MEEPTISVDFIVNNVAVRGPRGQVRHQPPAAGAAVQGAGAQRRAQGRADRQPDTHSVSGRGELHLGILMETMRREGYEFQVSRPRVITRTSDERRAARAVRGADDRRARGVHGRRHGAPGPRRAEMLDMKNDGVGMVRLAFKIPARGLFGYRVRVPDRHARHRASCITGSWSTDPGRVRWRGASVACWWPTGRVRSWPLRSATCRSVARCSWRRATRLRGDDRRRELAPGRPRRERDQGEEADQHAHLRLGREHHARAAAADHARVRPRVHRGGRADRGDADGDPPAEARAAGQPSAGRQPRAAARVADAS